jgi:sirohydrochlorin ferrochelatase
MAHGGDPQWNRTVEATVAPVRTKCPTEIAYGMADPNTMRDAVARLEARGVRRIAVVRMFVSGESFLPETEYILGLRSEPPPPAEHAAPTASHGDGHHCAPPEPIPTRASFILSRRGVPESPLIDEILVERVRALSTDPSKESVLFLAHGPGDDGENARWLEVMRQRTRRVREVAPFRDVRCETLREDWPEKRSDAEHRIRRYVFDAARNGGRVIVVPFRIAGFGPYREVLAGLEYVADGRGFCPHPNMTRWIEQTAAECPAAPQQPPRIP